MKQLFELGEFLPYRFDRLAKHISVSLAGVYRGRFAVSVPQWRVLALLQQTPQMSAKEVARLGNLDKVMVSRAVSGLEARGLLKRQVRLDDARVNELCLTPAGTALFEAIAPLALCWEHDFLAVLNQQERKTLARILDKLEQHSHTDTSSSTLRRSA